MRIKTVLVWVMGPLTILAGLNHFRDPAFYIAIMPPYLPGHAELVALSGVAEILLGVAVLVPRVRSLAGWGLVALLVAVFPANLHMALHPELYPDVPVIGLYLRLPIQALLILWAWWCTRPDAPADSGDPRA
jgi:uncharacterized membrane protein